VLLLDEPANGLDPAGIAAVRETMRDLASRDKTVFVSSHILGEVRLMVDIVGIINAGRLVREGPIDELLAAESRMRLRVAPGQTGAAVRALAALPGPRGASVPCDELGWLTVAVHPDRGAEVSRLLARADIYPVALEPAGELVPLFLRLTG
jgi:ABC-2 type transport system ATP-binding protein